MTLIEDELEVPLQPPPPFSVLYCPVLNEWTISAPEPLSLNKAYTDAGKGRKRRVLVADAVMWKNKMRDAISATGLPPIADYPWDKEAPMRFYMAWYPRNRRADIANREKVACDALSGTAIWKDDHQIIQIIMDKIEGSTQPGIVFIRVTQDFPHEV